MHKDDKVASLAPSQTVISRKIDRIQMMKQTNSESFGQISTCRTAVNTVRTNLPPNINSIFLEMVGINPILLRFSCNNSLWSAVLGIN